MNREEHVKLMMEMYGKSKEEINQMFDSGMFNNLCYGAMILSLKRLGMDEKAIKEAIEECRQVFNQYRASELLEAYKSL